MIKTREELEEMILNGDQEVIPYYDRILNGEDEKSVIESYNTNPVNIVE
jgi:hypothetical protein